MSLLFLLSACATETRKEPPPQPPILTCSSGNALCGAMAGAMLIISAATSSHSAAERRVRSRQITGTCEVLVPEVKSRNPCGSILVTVTDAKGTSRRAWIEDREFEINHLTDGPFTITAESEKWGVSSTVENVKLGSQIEIQLKPKSRVAQPK